MRSQAGSRVCSRSGDSPAQQNTLSPTLVFVTYVRKGTHERVTAIDFKCLSFEFEYEFELFGHFNGKGNYIFKKQADPFILIISQVLKESPLHSSCTLYSQITGRLHVLSFQCTCEFQ